MTTNVAAQTIPEGEPLRAELLVMAAYCEVGSAMAARELGGGGTLAGNCADA